MRDSDSPPAPAHTLASHGAAVSALTKAGFALVCSTADDPAVTREVTIGWWREHTG